MTSARTICLAILTAAGVATVPAPGHAQQVCGFCSDNYNFERNEWTHTFGQSGAMLSCGPNFCHYQPSDGWCGSFHDACSHLAARQADAIRSAVQGGEAAKLRSIVSKSGPSVRVVVTGTAVEVWSCKVSRPAAMVSVARAALAGLHAPPGKPAPFPKPTRGFRS